VLHIKRMLQNRHQSPSHWLITSQSSHDQFYVSYQHLWAATDYRYKTSTTNKLH